MNLADPVPQTGSYCLTVRTARKAHSTTLIAILCPNRRANGSSLRSVSIQDSKAVFADLQRICQAATVIQAEQAINHFATTFEGRMPESHGK